MSKEELENAIKNGDSVWVVNDNKVIEKNASSLMQLDNKFIELDEDGYFRSCEYFFKTQTQAQHYLDHANVTKTETLPFITWEEFLSGEYIEFFNDKRIFIRLYATIQNKIVIATTIHIIKVFEATEENFYKAYDECVKLFKGEYNG